MVPKGEIWGSLNLAQVSYAKTSRPKLASGAPYGVRLNNQIVK